MSEQPQIGNTASPRLRFVLRSGGLTILLLAVIVIFGLSGSNVDAGLTCGQSYSVVTSTSGGTTLPWTSSSPQTWTPAPFPGSNTCDTAGDTRTSPHTIVVNGSTPIPNGVGLQFERLAGGIDGDFSGLFAFGEDDGVLALLFPLAVGD